MKFTDNLKNIIFGENNQNLDPILDYYYSLRLNQKNKFVISIVSSGALFFILIISSYVIMMSSMQKNLDTSISATNELKKIKSTYVIVNNSFSEIEGKLNYNKPEVVVSFLKKTTKNLDVDIKSMNEKPVLLDLPFEHPLGNKFKLAKIDLKFSNLSLKKTMMLINSIQNSDLYLKVSSLNIQQTLNNKIYFEVSMTVDSYVPIESSHDSGNNSSGDMS